MQIGQYTALSGANADLAALTRYFNGGYYDGNYYYATVDVGNSILYIKQVDGVAGTTTTADSYDFSGLGITANDSRCVLRILYIGTKWFLIGACAGDDGTDSYCVYCFYKLTDGGAWVHSNDNLTVGVGAAYIDPYPLDIVYFSGSDSIGILCLTTSDLLGANAGVLYWVECAYADGSVAGRALWEQVVHYNIYAGAMHSGTYYLVNHTGVLFYRYTITDPLAAGSGGDYDYFTLPVVEAVEDQFYWKQDGFELLWDQDHLYYKFTDDWQYIVSDGETCLAPFFSYNSSNILILTGFVYAGLLYKITTNYLSIIQKGFADTARVGLLNWFTDGVDTIYQYGGASSKDGTACVFANLSLSMLKGSFEELTAQSDWAQDEGIVLYSDDDELYGTYLVERLDKLQRKIFFKSPLLIDLATRITLTAATNLDTVLDTYLIYCTSAVTPTISVPACVEKALGKILDESVVKGGYVWYLTPDLVLTVDDGTTATVQDYKRGVAGVLRHDYDADGYDYKVDPETGAAIPGVVPFDVSLTGWSNGSGVDCSVELIASFEGHKNVYKGTDGSAVAQCRIGKTFTAVTSGVIECYYYPTTTTQFLLILTGTGGGIYTYSASNKFYLYDGVNIVEICAMPINAWYHIKFTFDTTNWTCTIDGVAYDTLALYLSPSDFYLWRFESNVATTPNEAYIDAVGGTMFGLGTYVAGSNRSFWGGLDTSGTGCSVSVIESISTHLAPIQLYDNNATYYALWTITFTAQVTGFIELWWRTTDVTKRSYVQFTDGTLYGPIIYIDSSKFYYFDGSDHEIVAAANNTDYHLYILFNCTTDAFTVIINGTSYGPYNHRHNTAGLTTLLLQTYAGDSAYYAYFDGIGFSWDGYQAGANASIMTLASKVNPKTYPQSAGAVKVIYANNESVTVTRTAVGGQLLVYQFPSIPTSALATAKATQILADTNLEILTIRCLCWEKPPFQVGQMVPFHYTSEEEIFAALGIPANYYILQATYKEEDGSSTLLLADARAIPRPTLNAAIVDEKVAVEAKKSEINQRAINTIAANDTTPDVSAGGVFKTSANTGATAITDLDNPTAGQMIILLGGSDTNSSTITDGGNFKLNGNMTLGLGDSIILLVNADNDYWEISRTTV